MANVIIHDSEPRPPHIDITRFPNGELEVIRGSDTCLIFIGESWCYGQNFTTSLEDRLNLCMANLVAKSLGVDLYEFSIPGNSNGLMLEKLRRILDTQCKKYEKLFVILMMTEQSRELQSGGCMQYDFEKIYDGKAKTLEEFLTHYDNFFLNEYKKLFEQYNVDKHLIWRNFCRWNIGNLHGLNRVEQTMCEIFLRLNAPRLIQLDWLTGLDERNISYEYHDPFIQEQLELNERFLDEIAGHRLISSHPTEEGHKAWSEYLVKSI